MHDLLADLHLHTCLSPCGSLEMSPTCIVETALERGLQVIAVTDHNATMQCGAIQEVGQERGLTVFAGVEVTTREEAHCLLFFPDETTRLAFQTYIDTWLPPMPNDPERFGDQVWVNRYDEIEGEAPYLLISALNRSVNQIAAYARQLGCLFVPAHVERPMNSLIGQLGFIDPTLPIDAVEYNQAKRFAPLLSSHRYLNKHTLYTASDAHYPEQIGTNPSLWHTDTPTFDSLRRAFAGVEGYSIRSASSEPI
ncbi:PHP domain-containing protein [Parabacteroides sp. OttesenSCG-928-N08]|nr:PHP domain-containing protein [Parabacteroides sp. OttesenSCG-928-N08]